MITRIATALTLMLLGTPAIAADKPKPAKEAQVCRLVDAPTGSHMGGGRVCKTAAEWQADHDAAQMDKDLRQQTDKS